MKLDMIGLNVKDIKKSVEFYKIIGLDITYGTDNDQYVEVGNERIRISLNNTEMIQDLSQRSISNTDIKCELAFLCEDEKEVNGHIENMRKHKIEILQEPFHAPWNQYYAMVQDPDGHTISFFVNKK